jgi:hypothetical protein
VLARCLLVLLVMSGACPTCLAIISYCHSRAVWLGMFNIFVILATHQEEQRHPFQHDAQLSAVQTTSST